MKTVIRKAYWNYENEETWLNRMAKNGLALIDYSWCKYTFEDAEKGEYIYRIELLEQLATHEKSREYIAFMEDSDVECIATYMRWVYFRKKAEDGPFDLFSDLDSKLAHYRRVQKFWQALIILEMVIGLYNLFVSLFLRSPISWLNFLCAILMFGLSYLLYKLHSSVTKRIAALEKERQIRE